MDTPPANPSLPSSVRGALAAVRRRIRAYVWVEGLAVLVAMFGAAFWLGLAGDWYFEPTPAVRKSAMIGIGGAAFYIVYRYLIRRVFVSISDSSAALLLERRFPELGEHLLTAVEVTTTAAPAKDYHPELLARTARAAEEAVAGVRVSELFNRGPLLRSLAAAMLLMLSIVVFALGAREAFGIWLNRLAMSEEPWPRRVHLEIVGFAPDATGRRSHKLARDDDFELQVHASTQGFAPPEEVEIRFRLADGRRGRDTMIRVGDSSASTGEFQLFRYEFKHVAGEMEFDVVGGDDRVRDLHLEVVERPELHDIEVECHYPKYLGRESRRLPVTGGMRIPEGTHLILHANATKSLVAARVRASRSEQESQLDLGPASHVGAGVSHIQWEYGVLGTDDVLRIDVTDIDGVGPREPYRISLSAIRDEVPQVAARLSGISTAITPDAMLPFVGRVTDDYGLARLWYEYQIDSVPMAERPLARQPKGEPAFEQLGMFDTRATDPQTGQRVFQLRPKQRLALSLKATDQYDLSQDKRIGSSQSFELEVVTPADLLALMERRELTLRQRFESIYEKLTDTRNMLGRIETDDASKEAGPPSAGGTEARDELGASAAGDQPAESETGQRALARRRLRVAGALQNVLQAADEVKGIAESFDDLGEELTNNRIDIPDLKARLGEQIAKPLHQITEHTMPPLSAQLRLVEDRLDDPAAMTAELQKAIAQADELLVAMRQVLDHMLELETYNEVVSLLRDIITDQEEINRRTKERQKEKLKGLLE
ncbi:MAG: hypothetical protein IT425_12685 [Pirellulales bacterium]|nr:hypothetical protein [Pirellulales bacterium]